MKLTTLLLFIVLFQVSATSYSQATHLNLKFEKETLENVFNKIEENSEFSIFYKNELIRNSREITGEFKDALISEILDGVLKSENLSYIVRDRLIMIVPKDGEKGKLYDQQQKSVTGKITDEKGNPLPGVTVTVKGTSLGTLTDATGKYSINNVTQDATLIFSFVGMTTQEIPTAGKMLIDVVLKELAIGLDEVVVIGYGTSKKSDLTGSVGIVSKKEMGDRVVSSIGQLIQGKVAGVDVTNNSIRIRGETSFYYTDPLIVIDGFLGGSMSTINPDDIESIEVLKDASSTAIYGSRGANGVILVTTKSGKAGPLKVNINIFSGFASPSKKLDLLNASQYVDYLQEGLTNAGLAITDHLKSDYVRVDRTDWQDAVLRTSPLWEVNSNISGGSENSTFLVSLSYKHHEEVYIGPSYDQVNMKLKNQYNIKKWFKAGDNVSITFDHSQGSTPVYQVPWFCSLPYLPVYDKNNYWGYGIADLQNDLSNSNNVVAYANLRHPVDNTISYQADLLADIEPIKGLIYHIQAGVTGSSSRFVQWNDQFEDVTGSTIPADLTKSFSYGIYPLLESYLTYSHKFGKHDLTAMVGNTWQNYCSSGGIEIYGQDYNLSSVQNVLLAKTSQISYEANSTYAYLSYFGRLNYQFNNRYLLTVNMRRDGSPRFAPANRWGTFPSVALAWKMNEEDFIKNLNLFDQLKLRASWGISGNDNIGDFRYLSQVWTDGSFYPLGTTQTPVQGATVVDDAAQRIKWESTTSKNVGLDMVFLKNALSVTAEYFIKNTNDILFEVPRAASLGYGLIMGGDATINAASCVNKGFELQVDYKNNIGELNYSVDANYTNVNNKVTSLGLGQPYLAADYNRTAVGYPIGYIYGYVSEGVFMTQAALDAANKSARDAALAANPALTPADLADIYYQYSNTSAGDLKFKDINGDGKVTDKDRTKIGNSIPKHMFGFAINLGYKGFDLNAVFQGTAGSDLFPYYYPWIRSLSKPLNQDIYALNRWKSEAEPGNGMVPRAVIGDPTGNNRPSTAGLYSGDYLKLKQLSIGYTFPQKIYSKIGLSKLRIYASGNNLLTFTKYPYLDPETQNGNLTRAADMNLFPTARTITVGFLVGL